MFQDLDILETQLSNENGEEIEEITKKLNLRTTSDFLYSSDSDRALPLTTINCFRYILVLIIEHYTHLILMKLKTQGAYIAAFTYTFYESNG